VGIQVSKIKISNILGIESLEIEPGKFTAITGRNGSGKTSTLEAIKCALKGGHDATLLRNGAEVGEVVLVLDDGSKIRKRVTPTESKLTMIDADGERSKSAATDIKRLIDALSVNPIEFLAVPRKQQIAALLEAMPLRADVAKLAEIIGQRVAPEFAEAHAFDAIEAVHLQVFEMRTGANRAIKEKNGTIAQLEAAIPDALVDLDAVDETALEAAIADIDSARDTELARVDAKLAGMEPTWEARIAELTAQIDAVKNERVDVRARAEKQRQVTRDKAATDKQPITDSLNLIRLNRDAAAKARATRETIDKMHADLEALKTEADGYTEALDRLAAYRSELLESLPIKGLSVRDGEIYFGDVVFDRLNSAEQVKVAVEVAKLRAGTLGLVCVDGIERLDPEEFEAFREQAIASGVQLVVTRVGDGPLAVEASE